MYFTKQQFLQKLGVSLWSASILGQSGRKGFTIQVKVSAAQTGFSCHSWYSMRCGSRHNARIVVKSDPMFVAFNAMLNKRNTKSAFILETELSSRNKTFCINLFEAAQLSMNMGQGFWELPGSCLKNSIFLVIPWLMVIKAIDFPRFAKIAPFPRWWRTQNSWDVSLSRRSVNAV